MANHLLISRLFALLVLRMALLAYQESTLDTGQARHVIHDVAADPATDFIYDLLLQIPRVGTFPGKPDLRVWYGYQVLLIETFVQRLELHLIDGTFFHDDA